jgi:glycosyl transferase family 25
LDRSADRLRSVASDLDGANLNWVRFRAVEPPLSTYLDHHLYNSRLARKFNGVDLNRGQMGCFLSHIGVIEAFLSSDDAYLLVLEDDVAIVDDSVRVLSEVLAYLRAGHVKGWQCLNLTEVYSKRRRLIVGFDSWRLYRAYYFPILTSGLLWSRSGAKSFLNHVLSKGVFLPVDQQLRFHLAEVGGGLSLGCPVIQLRNYSSTIQLLSGVAGRHHVSRFTRNLHNYWFAFVAQLKDRLDRSFL